MRQALLSMGIPAPTAESFLAFHFGVFVGHYADISILRRELNFALRFSSMSSSTVEVSQMQPAH